MTLAIYIAGLIPSPSSFPLKAFMKLMGPPLILLLYCLCLFVTYTYFAFILPWYHSRPYFSFSITSFGLTVLYCILFNYTKCLLTPPGYPQGSNAPLCNKCKTNKPLRAHHCSVCDKCVLKMDHHCPWINNCLGLKNHSYFLLFLLYLDIGCFFYSAVGLRVMVEMRKNVFVTISGVLCLVFSIVLLLFGGWHWMLAIKGKTTIEYFKNSDDFSCGGWRKNLTVVFGTSNLLSILLPTTKTLTHDGAYWPETIHSI